MKRKLRILKYEIIFKEIFYFSTNSCLNKKFSQYYIASKISSLITILNLPYDPCVDGAFSKVTNVFSL